MSGRKESEVVDAVDLLRCLYALATGDAEVEQAQWEKLDIAAPALICGIVWALNERAPSDDTGAAEQPVADRPAETRDVAVRIASCACGSGRDYNRCCGAH